MVIGRKEEDFSGVRWYGSVYESVVWECCKMKKGGVVHCLLGFVVEALIKDR